MANETEEILKITPIIVVILAAYVYLVIRVVVVEQ